MTRHYDITQTDTIRLTDTVTVVKTDRHTFIQIDKLKIQTDRGMWIA